MHRFWSIDAPLSNDAAARLLIERLVDERCEFQPPSHRKTIYGSSRSRSWASKTRSFPNSARGLGRLSRNMCVTLSHSSDRCSPLIQPSHSGSALLRPLNGATTAILSRSLGSVSFLSDLANRRHFPVSPLYPTCHVLA